jgi:RNA polymerase sigma-70 factor (ECF subfamily)
MDPDDAIAAAKRGDATAFAGIYCSIAPKLLRYARGLVGRDAEDVVAEAWLQIARDIGRFSGGDSEFRAWTARIVRNRAMDHLRARARRPLPDIPLDDLRDMPAEDDTADTALARISASTAIDLIAALPPDQAEAVLLRAVVGLDAATAGAVIGKSAGAVRVAAHRGLKNLAKRLRDAEGGELR